MVKFENYRRPNREWLYGFIAEYHVHRSGCTAWAWVNAEQDHWF